MGVTWRGRRVAPSSLTGRRAASSPVNYYVICLTRALLELDCLGLLLQLVHCRDPSADYLH